MLRINELNITKIVFISKISPDYANMLQAKFLYFCEQTFHNHQFNLNTGLILNSEYFMRIQVPREYFTLSIIIEKIISLIFAQNIGRGE